ncbi:unnamed protein product, partial [Phaeothamnion confervicola]
MEGFPQSMMPSLMVPSMFSAGMLPTLSTATPPPTPGGGGQKFQMGVSPSRSTSPRGMRSACNFCHTKRIKCNRDEGATKCQQCVQRGMVCKFSPKEKTGPKPNKDKPTTRPKGDSRSPSPSPVGHSRDGHGRGMPMQIPFGASGAMGMGGMGVMRMGGPGGIGGGGGGGYPDVKRIPGNMAYGGAVKDNFVSGHHSGVSTPEMSPSPRAAELSPTNSVGGGASGFGGGGASGFGGGGGAASGSGPFSATATTEEQQIRERQFLITY